MLGDGKPIDLLKLYLCVKEKGGYESVSKNGIWNLDEWFCKTDSGNWEFGLKDVEMKVLDPRTLFSDVEMKDYKEFVDIGAKKGSDVEDLQSCVGSDEENELIRKRKRELYLPLLDWVKRVSKDPCDFAIGLVPDQSKWKVYGGEHVWRQVLSAREALSLKTNGDSKIKVKLIWQKNMRMHPTMYDDQTEKSTSRCSQRLISAKEIRSIRSSRKTLVQDCSESSSTGSPSDREDEDLFWGYNVKRKRTPLGRSFQAKVPELTEQTYEPDRKWLGIPIWPLDKSETRSSLIEIERIGKGRQDSCGCELQGSLKCVRFHISEKRNRVRLELGSAFFKFKFSDMGENVAFIWSQNEEKKFEDIIKLTPASSGTSFWDELCSHFKNKTTPVMVSYYFNVYLLRRRAHQNRSECSNIDSDDDELEKFGNIASNCHGNGSIFCSPKKVHLNVR